MDCYGIDKGLGGVLGLRDILSSLHWARELFLGLPPIAEQADSQSETVIASIGSFLTSLLAPTTSALPIPTFDILSLNPLSILSTKSSDEEALNLRNKHVFILSLTGTIARLATGLLADYLAPPLVAIPAPASDDPNAPTHLFVRKRKYKMSRSMFAALCAILLAAVFGWCSGYLKTERGLWVLSAGTGGLYGALFTLSVSSRSFRCHRRQDTDHVARYRIIAFRTLELRSRMGNGLVLRKLLRPFCGKI